MMYKLVMLFSKMYNKLLSSFRKNYQILYVKYIEHDNLLEILILRFSLYYVYVLKMNMTLTIKS